MKKKIDSANKLHMEINDMLDDKLKIIDECLANLKECPCKIKKCEFSFDKFKEINSVYDDLFKDEKFKTIFEELNLSSIKS